jgi:hypothetical protein
MFNSGDRVEALRHIASGWREAEYVADATETESRLPGAPFLIERHLVRFTPGTEPVIVGTVRKPAA